MFMSHISVSSTFINSFIEIRTIYHRNLGLSSPVPGISQAHPEQSAQDSPSSDEAILRYVDKSKMASGATY